VGGKPRIVSQQYLGSADEVIAKLAETPTAQPQRSQHKRFGDLAAVWSVLARLDVAGIVDEVIPRYANAAAPVGTYVALACANRIVDPCSKDGFADWWATTAGPRWVKLDRAALDHRRFWDAMDRLGQAELREVETRLGWRMVTEFGLELTGLALDWLRITTPIRLPAYPAGSSAVCRASSVQCIRGRQRGRLRRIPPASQPEHRRRSATNCVAPRR
jgi:hypothetical protein